MKMPMIAILVLGIALGAVLSAAADSGETPDRTDLDVLRKQVQALEKRIEVLERLLEQPHSNGGAPGLPPMLHGRPVPDTWLRREFNGIPYYVIPLQQDCNQPVRLRK